jgi:hypothetical protein
MQRRFTSIATCRAPSGGGASTCASNRFWCATKSLKKALLDELRFHCLHTHQIASRIERDAVREAGLTWRQYQSVIKGHEKAIDEEQLRHVPRDLDITPYKDLKDYPLLQRLIQASH